MKRKIVFLGGFFPKEEEKRIEESSKKHVQMAANVLQWKLIEGLYSDIIKLYTGISVGSFPKNYKDMYIKKAEYTYKYENDIKKIGFCNLSLFKQIFYHYSYMKELKKEFKNSKKDKVVIAYSCGLIKELNYIKKINPRIKCILIVPDLIEFTSLDNKNKFLEFYKKTEGKRFLKYISNNVIDGYVVLTSYMAEYLKLPKEKYVVIEGIASNINENNFVYRFNSMKTILYTGSLAEKYGIFNLIEEFKKVKGNYRLVICGGGNENQKIYEKCKEDSRIEFKGLVTHEEAIKLQISADILVNPRKETEEYTKYSFPSKLLEYLTTGRPVVCYKLKGIPVEYSEVFFYASSQKGGLAKKLQEVGELSEEDYNAYAKKAKELLKLKTPEKQCEKIMTLLEKV